VEYALTDKGLALLPIIDGMRAYGEQWLGEQRAEREAVHVDELIAGVASAAATAAA
jgi:DNA-binding HxlR family transcriptional regulator